jgi:hypothetical protein
MARIGELHDGWCCCLVWDRLAWHRDLFRGPSYYVGRDLPAYLCIVDWCKSAKPTPRGRSLRAGDPRFPRSPTYVYVDPSCFPPFLPFFSFSFFLHSTNFILHKLLA